MTAIADIETEICAGVKQTQAKAGELYGRVVRIVAISCVTAALASPSLRAQSGAEKGRCTIPGFPAPILCARAGLDTVHATYILLVDESGSMAPLWPAVKQALSEFAQAVPDGDELDIRLFSTSVRGLIAPVPANSQVRDAWRQSIQGVPAPRGGNTDLGRAAEAALTQVKSAPADRLQFIFFLTDGQQDPGPSSPFPAAWAGQWPQLATQGAMLLGSRPVTVAIVRLTAAADQSLLARAFPNAVVTDAIGPDALRNWFAHRSREVAVSKLTTLIRRELAQPIARIESNGPIVLHSKRLEQKDVGVKKRRQILTTISAEGSPVALSNGASITANSSLWSTDSSRLAITGPAHAPWVPPGGRPRTVDEQVVIRTRLEPAEELRRIGISPAERRDTLRVKLTLLTGGPLSAWLYYGMCVVLAVAAFLMLRGVRRSAHRAFLDGRIIIRGTDRASAGETHMLRGRELRTFTIEGTGGRELLRLEARNEKGRTVVYATPLASDVTLRNKPFKTPSALTGKSVFAANGEEVTYLLS